MYKLLEQIDVGLQKFLRFIFHIIDVYTPNFWIFI